MIGPRLKNSEPKLRTALARELRKSATPSERRLWQALRNRRWGGRRFRRQEPIGPFVVDFFCAEEGLVVEIDGPIHQRHLAADRARQELLEQTGLRFVRLTDAEVEHDLPG